MVLISLAFIFSDWSILHSSFGDFILVVILVMMIILKIAYIKNGQLLLMLLPFIIVFISSLYSYNFYDHWFQLERLLLSSAKIGLYIVTLVAFYNYIKMEKLEYQFLKISNVFAVITVAIALLVMILIQLEKSEIYNFLWTFTRTDKLSFTYGSGLIRARGLFSEPAHLGYYLNTIFFANLLSNKKNNHYLLAFFTFGIWITFSYSMILIYLATLVTYFITRIIKGKLNWSPVYLLLMISSIIIVLFISDFINEAIIERTLNIIEGTDGSAYNRLFESWMWVDRERLLFGNLIGHTPPITNIFAYFLSDFGLLGLIPYLLFTLYIALFSISGFVFFIGMNMAKGGYLNPAFWLMVFYVVLYFLDAGKRVSK